MAHTAAGIIAIVQAWRSLSAFSVTRTVAPVTARIAGREPCQPHEGGNQEKAFNPSVTVTFYQISCILACVGCGDGGTDVVQETADAVVQTG
ncbi:MAG: hypothetical protein WDN25_10680 [Acetobacteraceae bacterium]